MAIPSVKGKGDQVTIFIRDEEEQATMEANYKSLLEFAIRLVGNLCMVWIGRHRIHANAARFHRPKGSTSSHQPAMKGKIRDSSIGNTKDNGHRDDVKDVGVLENLKVALGNEGFTDIDLRYIGGLWVMISFDSVEANEKFLLSTGVCPWFSQLIQGSSEFITDERVTMVEIKGKTHWLLLKKIPGWTPNLDDQNDEESDSEDEECEEVFKKDFGESDEEVQGENDVSRVSDTEVDEENPKSKDGVVSSEQNGGDLYDSDHCRESEGSRKGGSILMLMDELVKVGQTMGYNMDGCMKNIEEIIESQGVDGSCQKRKSYGTYFVIVHCNWKVPVIINGVILMRSAFKDEYASPVDNSNVMINMMNKLKYLKKKIRVWNGMRQSPKTRKHVLKQELADLEMIIDKGDASSDTLHKRAEVVKSIQEVDKLCAMEASQKAKIKWAIERRRTKYYHGILNKKRNQLSIRGVLVEGDWVENPNMVKNEFLNHFKNRFDRPKSVRPMLNMKFPHHLNSMQTTGFEDEGNRSLRRKFQFFKGLKQGDPLSSFIFILVMKSLHISFKRVVDAGMFNGIVLNSVMHLSHMFYADDAVFMGQWSTKNIDTIIYVLKCFHRASGLSINLSKSKLLGVVVSEDRVVQAANRIGCGVLKAPFAYLGSKVGGNMSRIKSWDEIVDKMVDRLSKWKMKTLSIGGRLTLLKAVLGSMPIYHMSIFKVPMKVLQRMESIPSRFFSGCRFK
ncbi:RNA-directed DNA polymerase, eukaryota, reverse transcriptase zinc-binding domain protein [Tanacetum coccineum]